AKPREAVYGSAATGRVRSWMKVARRLYGRSPWMVADHALRTGQPCQLVLVVGVVAGNLLPRIAHCPHCCDSARWTNNRRSLATPTARADPQSSQDAVQAHQQLGLTVGQGYQ